MKLIYNNLIPYKGFVAINIFGLVFARRDAEVSERTLNHEAIHTAQMRELGYVPFYIVYFFEWLGRLLFEPDSRAAYHAISFEREAREHQYDYNYLARRKHFAQWRKTRTKWQSK